MHSSLRILREIESESSYLYCFALCNGIHISGHSLWRMLWNSSIEVDTSGCVFSTSLNVWYHISYYSAMTLCCYDNMKVYFHAYDRGTVRTWHLQAYYQATRQRVYFGDWKYDKNCQHVDNSVERAQCHVLLICRSTDASRSYPSIKCLYYMHRKISGR